jgi:hypothetical protein
MKTSLAHGVVWARLLDPAAGKGLVEWRDDCEKEDGEHIAITGRPPRLHEFLPEVWLKVHLGRRCSAVIDGAGWGIAQTMILICFRDIACALRFCEFACRLRNQNKDTADAL